MAPVCALVQNGISVAILDRNVLLRLLVSGVSSIFSSRGRRRAPDTCPTCGLQCSQANTHLSSLSHQQKMGSQGAAVGWRWECPERGPMKLTSLGNFQKSVCLHRVLFRCQAEVICKRGLIQPADAFCRAHGVFLNTFNPLLTLKS